MEQTIVEMSSRTFRIKEKIVEHWKEQEAQIHSRALQETKEKTRKWHADNVDMRETIEKTNIALFNQNKDSAPMSPKTEKIARMIFSGYTNKQ